MKKLLFLILCVFAVSCSKSQVDSITFNDGFGRLVYVGQTAYLPYVVLPSNLQGTQLSWTSSNPQVAYVIDGYVTGVAPGFCQITASSGKASSSINVEVQKLIVTKISLPLSSVDVPSGGSKLIEVNVEEPVTGTAQNLEFSLSSSAYSIDEKTEKGVYVSCQSGTPDGTKCTLKISNMDGLTLGSVNLTSVYRPLTGVSMSLSSTAQVGASLTATASPVPSNTVDNVDFIWTTSNTSVATIEGSGKSVTVNALSAGTATITVTDSFSGKSASQTLTVVKKRELGTGYKLGLYTSCKDDGNGWLKVSGSAGTSKTLKVVPKKLSPEYIIGADDGYAVSLSDLKLTYSITGSDYNVTAEELQRVSNPYKLYQRVDSPGSTCTVTAKAPNGTSVSLTLQCAVGSISMTTDTSRNPMSFDGTVGNGDTFNVSRPSSSYKKISFFINSGSTPDAMGEGGLVANYATMACWWYASLITTDFPKSNWDSSNCIATVTSATATGTYNFAISEWGISWKLTVK